MSQGTNNRQRQKWIFQVLLLILLFLLLAFGTWLYYEFRINQINRQVQSALKPQNKLLRINRLLPAGKKISENQKQQLAAYPLLTAKLAS